MTTHPSPAPLPKHELYEAPDERGITVNGWRVTSTTRPISNGPQTDALQADLGLTLPEMIFGNNSLTIEHQPSGWKYSFTAREALAAVKNGELEDGDGGVKVGYADAWLKSRCAHLNCPSGLDDSRTSQPIQQCSDASDCSSKTI